MKQVSEITNPGQPGKVLDKTEQREMRSAKKVGLKVLRSEERASRKTKQATDK